MLGDNKCLKCTLKCSKCLKYVLMYIFMYIIFKYTFYFRVFFKVFIIVLYFIIRCSLRRTLKSVQILSSLRSSPALHRMLIWILYHRFLKSQYFIVKRIVKLCTPLRSPPSRVSVVPHFRYNWESFSSRLLLLSLTSAYKPLHRYNL